MLKKAFLTAMILLIALAAAGCEGSSTTTPTTTTLTSSSSTTTLTITTVEEEAMYANPVFEPVLADPSIIQGDDGYYYVFGTQDYGQWGEVYGTKYIPILRSTDLVNWEYAGSVFTLANRPTWGTPNAGLWGPDIVRIGTLYYLYYSPSTWGDPNPGIGVATAEHPLGPWTDHGKLFDSLSIGVNNSIDPCVFPDEEGNLYLIWGSFRGIYGVELAADGLSLKNGSNADETKVLLAGYDTATNWNVTTYEGSYVIFKDGFYYLFLSTGSCCEGLNSSYNVVVGRSVSPLGPYIDADGDSMLAGNRGYSVVKGSSYFVGTGHNAVIRDAEGEYWIVYHAFDTSEPGVLGNTNRRSLMIDRLIWNQEGWPQVFGAMPSNRETIAPKT